MAPITFKESESCVQSMNGRSREVSALIYGCKLSKCGKASAFRDERRAVVSVSASFCAKSDRRAALARVLGQGRGLIVEAFARTPQAGTILEQNGPSRPIGWITELARDELWSIVRGPGQREKP